MAAVSVSELKQTVSREERDQIVVEHLPLVKAIAIRVHENLPVHVELDDLIHAGVLGLFDAVEKYSSDKNVEFQAYAKHRIKGAILDSLRQADWASRDMRRRQKQVDAMSREFTAKFGRTPTENEIANELGVSTERWRRMSLELRNIGVVSMTPREDQENQTEREFPADSGVQPDHICEQRQLKSTLNRAMGKLPERYQKVVFLYYTNQLTMKEIGDVMGVNESRISQIHKLALKKMAAALQSEGIESSKAL
ncbi:MAG TPA: FliA/WhiG family RNA polymerase sigma factor [Bryobacteraceae bacterium]|jgi:RNA polymerase sigma factor for flagellar operon FliA|nr:FliA/WhiG family RNA polymerase sigma factor [Bryobacteraceae bacterium]